MLSYQSNLYFGPCTLIASNPYLGVFSGKGNSLTGWTNCATNQPATKSTGGEVYPTPIIIIMLMFPPMKSEIPHSPISWNIDVGVIHPNLWDFIRKMKERQVVHEQRVAEALSGRRPPRRRRKWRELEARYNDLKGDLINGQLTLDEYWRNIRATMHDFS